MTIPLPTLRPPTDNLHKFLAVLGLIFIFGGFAGSVILLNNQETEISALEIELSKVEALKRHLEDAHDELRAATQPIAEWDRLYPDSKTTAKWNPQDVERFMEFQKTMRADALKLGKEALEDANTTQEAADELDSRIHSVKVHAARLREMQLILGGLGGIGVYIVASSVRRWHHHQQLHNRHQELQNDLLRAQIADHDRKNADPKADKPTIILPG